MHRFTLLAACLLPLIAAAEDAQSIIDTAYEKQLERWEGVESYAVTQTVMGQATTTVFKRTQTTRADGSPRVEFLPDVPGEDYDMDIVDTSDQMMDIIERAELIGTETVQGKQAYHLRANDVSSIEGFDDEDFTVDAISVWLDTDAHVPLKMSIDGTITEGAQSRAGNVIVIQGDYRTVPGSKMYEPYRQTVEMQSIMSEADMAELEQARAQLEELEKQMATMPEGQRAMMEQMMGPQLDAMRSMVQDGGLTIEVVVESIEVNPE